MLQPQAAKPVSFDAKVWHEKFEREGISALFDLCAGVVAGTILPPQKSDVAAQRAAWDAKRGLKPGEYDRMSPADKARIDQMDV